MRWQPEAARCEECGFDWRCGRADAVAEVAAGPGRVAVALGAVSDPFERAGDRWSASMYVWHLVDVLRIGTERLLTLALDPARGVPCWDENALAQDRRYQRLSPAVGLVVLERAAGDWVEAAGVVSDDVQVQHPEFGTVAAVDLVRRDAHEVHHHAQDIAG